MPMERHGNRGLLTILLTGTAPLALILSTGAAQAQDSASVSTEQRVSELERLLREQRQEIDGLKQQLWQAQDSSMALMHGRGLAAGPQDQPASSPPQSSNLPYEPVGEAPSDEDEKEQLQARVQAVPEGQGVLTPKGVFQVEPSLEYVLSSTNRLVFRGVELVPGLQIGIIEASKAARDTVIGSDTFRFGLTDRLEAEVRVPVLYRHDKIEVVQQRDEGIVRTLSFSESHIGDVEFALRYQINRPTKAQEPIFVGSLRVKSDTGKGPFDIGYDEFGIATGLATGSGFWAVQPAINFLLPSDPVVIYGGVGYLYHIGKDVNKTIGGAPIGHVDPGDAISGNLGFGFALNPRFSFSLGYRHSYIFQTKTQIADTVQKSDKLQAGSLLFGMSYRMTEKQALNIGFEFGVTEDAPDVSITMRMPFDWKL